MNKLLNTEHWWSDTDKKKYNTLRKTCTNATLTTINPTWSGLGLNPDLHSDRPATNSLTHGTALNIR